MTDERKWPVEIAALGRESVATMLWKKGEQLHVTVLVKVTFAFAPGGAMSPIDPVEIRRVELHHGENPTRSICAPAELWPFLPSAEVLLTGHAHCPSGREERVLEARLCLLRNRKTVLDKTLLVFGDRVPPARGEAPPEPAPFRRMPLVYERAYGGIGSPDNPFGVGFGSKPGRRMPNIVHPTQGPEQMAGFGPISCYVPARKRLLHGAPRKLLEGRVAELPDELDPAYFHSAPEDQRIPKLRGDEQIVLENLHPSFPRLEMRLPHVKAAARIYTPDGLELALPLHADMLLIDGDRETCSLVFRASLPVHDESLLPNVSILGAVSMLGESIHWPTSEQHRAPGARPLASQPPPPAPPPPADFSQTQQLGDADVIPVDSLDAPTAMLPVAMLVPSEVASAGLDSPRPAAGRWEGTYVLNDAESNAAATFQAPFAVPPPGSSQPGIAAPIPGAPFSPRTPLETLPLLERPAHGARKIPVVYAVSDDDEDDNLSTRRIHVAPKVTFEDPPTAETWVRPAGDDRDPSANAMRAPFPLAAPRARESETAAPIPGAPWDPSSPAHPAIESSDDAVETLQLRPPPQVEPSVQPVEPGPPPAEPPRAEPAVEKKPPGPGWSWASVAGSEKEAAERDPKPRPPPAPKPAVKGSLYGKFGSKK